MENQIYNYDDLSKFSFLQKYHRLLQDDPVGMNLIFKDAKNFFFKHYDINEIEYSEILNGTYDKSNAKLNNISSELIKYIEIAINTVFNQT